jgi:flagellar hook-associated protein 3 FlgL
MISRVTQALFTEQFQRNVQRVQRDLLNAQQTVSTGRKLLSASDDPTGADRANTLHAELNDLGSLQKGISFGVSVLGAQDSAIGNAESILVRAREIAAQQANGLTSVADRQQAAAEVAQLESGLLTLGNTQISGRAVFGQLATGSLPFQQLGAPGFTPATAYQGATGTFSIRTGPDQSTTRITTQGDQVFTPSVQALDDLRQTLAAGNVPTASIDAIDQAANVLRQERSSIGGRLQRLQDRSSEISTGTVDLQKEVSSVEDADVPTAISQYVQLQNALQATLQSSNALKTSILDFFTP